MKVTQANPQDQLRSATVAMIRRPVLFMLDAWGFKRPDKIDFQYSVEKLAILMRMRYGRFYTDYLFDDQAVNPIQLTELAEAMAQDDRIPIAEEL